VSCPPSPPPRGKAQNSVRLLYSIISSTIQYNYVYFTVRQLYTVCLLSKSSTYTVRLYCTSIRYVYTVRLYGTSTNTVPLSIPRVDSTVSPRVVCGTSTVPTRPHASRAYVPTACLRRACGLCAYVRDKFILLAKRPEPGYSDS
jgi:hypothetical protein